MIYYRYHVVIYMFTHCCVICRNIVPTCDVLQHTVRYYRVTIVLYRDIAFTIYSFALMLLSNSLSIIYTLLCKLCTCVISSNKLHYITRYFYYIIHSIQCNVILHVLRFSIDVYILQPHL